MATTYTTPPTFTATVFSVADANTYIRDNTKALHENIGNVRGVASKTTTYTATVDDGALLCNGTFTVTLPAAASAGANFVLQVKNTGTGTITIDGNGSETIDGALTQSLSQPYASLSLLCDGTGWHII